jgi:arabinan endo-1,5-alpha-L-arabinosidase
MFAGTGVPIPPQDVAQVSKNWPAGNGDLRLANYMSQAQQKWTITAVPNMGGYPGSPYFKMTVAGTDRALAVSADAELVVVPAFTNAPEQLWQFDQLSDGTWRIIPKSLSGGKTPMALSAIGSSFPTLEKFDASSGKQHWLIKGQ